MPCAPCPKDLGPGVAAGEFSLVALILLGGLFLSINRKVPDGLLRPLNKILIGENMRIMVFITPIVLIGVLFSMIIALLKFPFLKMKYGKTS